MKDLNLFNLSLLGKWKWRFLTDKDSVWVRILSERYRNLSQLNSQKVWTSTNSSQWWRDLSSPRRVSDEPTNWFLGGVARKVGNETKTGFWGMFGVVQRVLKSSSQDCTPSPATKRLKCRIWESGWVTFGNGIGSGDEDFLCGRKSIFEAS